MILQFHSLLFKTHSPLSNTFKSFVVDHFPLERFLLLKVICFTLVFYLLKVMKTPNNRGLADVIFFAFATGYIFSRAYHQ